MTETTSEGPQIASMQYEHEVDDGVRGDLMLPRVTKCRSRNLC